MANEQTGSTGEKSKSGIADFVRETQREISKVTWPSQKEISVTTLLIVVFAVLMGVFFLVVDSGLGYAVSSILGLNS